jgi:hypothetical protein
MTDEEMIITLHDVARTLEGRDPVYAKEMRQIADRFSELAKKVKEDEQSILARVS